MKDTKLVVVRDYGSRLEAEVAISALEGVGIPATMQADTAGGMREHLAWSGAGFRIVVREEDATAANDLLSPAGDVEIPDADHDSHPSWRKFT